MSTSVLEQLAAVDPVVLTEVVRQDRRSASFEIDSWHVASLSNQGIINPEGLFRFYGTGFENGSPQSWSVVLKILRKPEEDQDLREMFYWKRELLDAQSTWLPNLPGPVVAPRIYRVDDYADSGWIWMEHVIETLNHPWTSEQYAFAAREIGRFNGKYLTGTPFPDEPWLCTEHWRWWLAIAERYQNVWENPYVRKAITATLRKRVERLWAEKEVFFNVLNQLPQVFSHFDFQRRNIFIRQRPDGGDELVAIDWALVGHGAVGGDLYELIGGSLMLFEMESEQAPDLEALAFAAYLAGLRDAGWTGDPDLARLGYTAWLALCSGAAGPALIDAWTSGIADETVVPGLGRRPAEIAAGWASLCAFALERADEARRLMGRLRLR